MHTSTYTTAAFEDTLTIANEQLTSVLPSHGRTITATEGAAVHTTSMHMHGQPPHLHQPGLVGAM
jgi:hypothetical protein